MIKVLSRLPDRSMFGLHRNQLRLLEDNVELPVAYFSIEVAKLVTQPFCHSLLVTFFRRSALSQSTVNGCSDGRKRTWPSRVPLRINCSAILEVTEWREN
jgi:hypothetical protein